MTAWEEGKTHFKILKKHGMLWKMVGSDVKVSESGQMNV